MFNNINTKFRFIQSSNLNSENQPDEFCLYTIKNMEYGYVPIIKNEQACGIGSTKEWSEAARCLEEGSDCDFKRLHIKFEKQGTIAFHACKNKPGKKDIFRISKNLAKTLAKYIRIVIDE